MFLPPGDTGGLPGLPGRYYISLVLSSNVRVGGGGCVGGECEGDRRVHVKGVICEGGRV